MNMNIAYLLHTGIVKVTKKKSWISSLLCSAEERGINIHAKYQHRRTLREMIITEIKDGWSEIEGYTEATYKILNINPSVDLKRAQ